MNRSSIAGPRPDTPRSNTSRGPALRPADAAPASKRAGDDDRTAVKSLRKALTVLNVVAGADRALSVAEIALRAGIARPTAYRFVQTLVADGYLVQNAVDGRFAIGFAVLPLAASLLDQNRLRIEALPHLNALAQQTGERANLGILYRDRLLYMAGVEKPALPTIYSRFGKTVPAHCCSLGKAILAYLPEPEAHELIARVPLTAYTPTSITDPAAVMAELAETRARGYAVDRAEITPGSFCLAVPIFDARNRPIAAIGLSGRALDPLVKHQELLHQTAELISHLL